MSTEAITVQPQFSKNAKKSGTLALLTLKKGEIKVVYVYSCLGTSTSDYLSRHNEKLVWPLAQTRQTKYT